MENLILAGWGWKVYPCAAALALRALKKAHVFGVSKRKLPEYLSEVTDYKNIVIVGIGLEDNPELLKNALKRLKEKGVHVTWISALPLPESVDAETCSLFETFIEEGTLLETVSHYYKLPCDDLVQLAEEDAPGKPVPPEHLLLDAAMYYHRNYQEEIFYGMAIYHIAHRESESSWGNLEKQMVEHYKRFGSRELVGKSEAIRNLLGQINLVAPHDHARVMIFGESGTGKETVALQIHNKSPRRENNFVAFNCASVNPNLLESRFFGHEKGAFTDAKERAIGLFEYASGGTLFLDEIGEIPLEAQALLLRILEGGRFTRLGGHEEVVTDARLICATHRDLAAMVRDGLFREDLFYRLNVIQIRIPALREHKSDIGQIADGYWLKQHHHRLEPEQIEALKTYDYPGNVRELFNLLERAIVLGEQDFNKLIADHKRMLASLAPKAAVEVPDELEAAIRLHVKHVYEKYNNNLSKTAEALKAARNTVRKYLERC